MLVLLGALLVGVTIGIAAHEFLHAIVLRAFGIPFSLELFPREATRVAGLPIGGAITTVTIESLPSNISPWQLRLAAMMPLALSIPFFVAASISAPIPARPLDVVTIGLLACAIPSPADFAIAWRPDKLEQQVNP